MNLNKHVQTAVDSLILPALFVLCLDLSNFSALTAFFVLSLLSFVTRSFSSSVIRLIQALTTVASTFWILDELFTFVVSPITIFGFVLVSWVTLCFLFRSRSDFNSANLETLIGRLVLGFYFLYVFLMKPSGFIENLSMLEAEDNESWLNPVLEFHRTGQVKLDVPLGSEGVQFFIRVFTTFVSSLSQQFGDNFTALSAIKAISNSWVFALLCSLVIVQLFLSEILSSFPKLFERNILVVSSLLLVLVFFRVSLLPGHLSQYLLGLVIFSFLYLTSVKKVTQSKPKQITNQFCSICVIACILGSYNPWLPVTIFCVLVFVTNEFKLFPLGQKLLKDHPVLVFIVSVPLGAILARILFSKFSGLHVGGGVWRVFGQSLWFFSGVILFVFLMAVLLPRDRTIESRSFDLLWPWTLFTIFAIFSTIIIVNPNFQIISNFEISDLAVKLQLLSVILIFGYLLLPSTFISVRKSIVQNGLASSLQNSLFLALFTFCFVLFIWLLSVFTGPKVAAYAAQKSVLSFFGQFFWILLLIHTLRSQAFSKLKRLTSSLVMVCLVVFGLGLLPMARQVLLAKPFGDVQGLYDSWWYNDVLFELGADPNAIVVCVNPDWRVPDMSVYTCNRFLQTLTKYRYPAGGFRYLAWYQPGEFGLIQTYFDTTELSSNVVVISNTKVNDETMEIFRGVNPKYLKIVIDSNEK